MTGISDEEAIKKRSVLELTNSESRAFFLKGESYNNLDLPPYFVFSELLNQLDGFLDGKNINSLRSESPRNFDDVNYHMMNNKDGTLLSGLKMHMQKKV